MLLRNNTCTTRKFMHHLIGADPYAAQVTHRSKTTTPNLANHLYFIWLSRKNPPHPSAPATPRPQTPSLLMRRVYRRQS